MFVLVNLLVCITLIMLLKVLNPNGVQAWSEFWQITVGGYFVLTALSLPLYGIYYVLFA